MTSLSNEMLSARGELQDVPDQVECCVNCGAEVDLTKSALLMRNRVMGCPHCKWASAPLPAVGWGWCVHQTREIGIEAR